MNMKELIVTLVVALITFFGYNSLNAQNMKKEEVPQNISAFPIGEENVGFKQYFTGESWLARLTSNKDLNVPMSNVCLLYTSPSPRDRTRSRMPSSA